MSVGVDKVVKDAEFAESLLVLKYYFCYGYSGEANKFKSGTTKVICDAMRSTGLLQSNKKYALSTLLGAYNCIEGNFSRHEQ